MHVACAVEGGYDAHSAVMLHSLVTSTRQRVHVHYLHGPDLAPGSRRRIARMLRRLGAGLSLHEIAPRKVAGLPVVEEYTAAMWFRILLPELLPEVDRVLYLDIDVLVLDDVAPLWQVNLEGRTVGAVTNVLLSEHRRRPEELGLAAHQQYFNSGVLLLNLEQMRREGSSAAMRALATGDEHRFTWPDQDALNLVLGEQRVTLSPRWNAMNSLWLPEAQDVFTASDLDEAREHPAIRHFEGPGDNKPWHAACRRAHAGHYLIHRRRTPWPWCSRAGSPRERAQALLHRARNVVRVSA